MPVLRRFLPVRRSKVKRPKSQERRHHSRQSWLSSISEGIDAEGGGDSIASHHEAHLALTFGPRPARFATSCRPHRNHA